MSALTLETSIFTMETSANKRFVIPYSNETISAYYAVWDSARVIEKEKHFACRKIKESLHIKRSVNCITTDPGYYMHPVWFRCFRG